MGQAGQLASEQQVEELAGEQNGEPQVGPQMPQKPMEQLSVGQLGQIVAQQLGQVFLPQQQVPLVILLPLGATQTFDHLYGL